MDNEFIERLSAEESRAEKYPAEKLALSKQVKCRLPRYYRYLKELLEKNNFRISSGKLAKLMGLTASQVRQDLNCFGGCGQQGYGYNVKHLFAEISEMLGVNEKFNAILIGAGNLGRAMADGSLFLSRGVNLIGVFDRDPAVIGKRAGKHTVYDAGKLEIFCRANRVDIAVLTLTSSGAEAMAERLVKLGVRGIWNFTSAEISEASLSALLDASEEKDASAGVCVQNVYLGDSLMQLCFSLRSLSDKKT